MVRWKKWKCAKTFFVLFVRHFADKVVLLWCDIVQHIFYNVCMQTCCYAKYTFTVFYSQLTHTDTRKHTQCDAIARNSFGMAGVPVAINTQFFWGHWQNTPAGPTLALFNSTSLLLCVHSYHVLGVFLRAAGEEK